MSSSNGRTKRSVERDKGGTRNTNAQTSRQEAQALELIRRAFASPNARLWDDIPDRDGGRLKSAWVDGDVLKRGNVNPHFPYPQSKMGVNRNSDWGGELGRRISQDLESEMKGSWEDWGGQGRQPSAMDSGHVFQGQKWQPDVPSDYNENQKGLYAALGRIFGR